MGELLSLVKSQAWALLGSDIDEQIQGREDTVHDPLPNSEAIYLQEYMKGEIAGLRTAWGYPSVMIDQLTAYIEAHRGEDDDD